MLIFVSVRADHAAQKISPLTQRKCKIVQIRAEPLQGKLYRGSSLSNLQPSQWLLPTDQRATCQYYSTKTRSEGHLSLLLHINQIRGATVCTTPAFLSAPHQISGAPVCPTPTLISTQTRLEGHLSVLHPPLTPPKLV